MLTCNSQTRPSWNCEQLANSSIRVSSTSKTSCVSLIPSLHGGFSRGLCFVYSFAALMWKIFLVIKEDFEHFVNTLSRTKNAKNLFRLTYFFKQFHFSLNFF